MLAKNSNQDYEADQSKLIPLDKIFKAYKNIKGAINRTPLTKLVNISEKLQANIFIKREDLQIVRSFKLRGAYNKFLYLTDEEKKRGVVCSSAGNHAQGVAYACFKMQVKGTIFMPSDAPSIKVRAVKMFGGSYIDIKLIGDTFDEALQAARNYCKENNSVFVHAYDDELVIAGAGTAAIETLEDFNGDIDYCFLPIGGGGLAAGMSSYIKQMSPQTTIIGCEPFGCPSMLQSIKSGIPSPISGINTFIDGAAVGTPGRIPTRILQETLRDIILIPEGVCCTSLLEMFQSEGIVCEPAGALCVAALQYYKEEIKGKNIVCMVSGSNNDLTRMTDIKILSEIEQKIRYYLLINFSSKFGALKEFITDILSDTDELLSLEYTKKSSATQSNGACLVGIQCKKQGAIEEITEKLVSRGITYKIIEPKDEIFKFLL